MQLNIEIETETRIVFDKNNKEKKVKIPVRVVGCYDLFGNDYVSSNLIPQDASFDQQMDMVALGAIWRMRRYAIDHETHLSDHNGEHFHGAALVRTNKGRYFLTSNIQMNPDPTSRNCAEMMAITESKQNRIYGERIDHIWFTGGEGKFPKKQIRDDTHAISPGEEGRHPTPCSSCSGTLFEENKGMKVRLLPFIKPEAGMVLDRYDIDAKNAPQDAVFTTTMRDLYGVEKLVVKDREQKEQVSKVIEFLESHLSEGEIKHYKRAVKASEGLHVEFNQAVDAKMVNELFMYRLKKLFQESPSKLRYAQFGFVQTGEKEGFLGVSFTNGTTPSSAPALSLAAQAATNSKLKGTVQKAFYMSVDVKELMRRAKEAKKNSFPHISFKRPSGVELERTRKASVHYGNGAKKDIDIVQIVPNPPQYFEEEMHTQAFNLADVVKKPWNGSKLVKKKRAEEVPGTGNTLG